MAPLIVFLFIFLEVTVMASVAAWIGWGLVLLMVGLGSLGGGMLLRGALGHAQERLAAAVTGGEDPGSVLEGCMARMAGGLLLLVPGFITDLLGLSVLLPLTRPIWRRLLKQRFSLNQRAGGFKFFNLAGLGLDGPGAAAPSSKPADKIIEADFEIVD